MVKEKILKVINVDNGSSEYPGSFAKKEVEIIKNWVNEEKTLHLFSGNSTIGVERVDFVNENATIKANVFEFLENNDLRGKYEYVVLDPPYNERFADKYNKKAGKPFEQFIIYADTKKTTLLFDLIREKVNPSYVVMKSWQYYILKGYEFQEGYVCYPGGYRKPTFLIKMKKVD